MPTINAYYADEKDYAALADMTIILKEFVAKELTCSDIALRPDEVSLRLIQVAGNGMLANIELELTAHAFDERIEKQDEICLRIREFLKQHLNVKGVRVWLLLPQLGHSWE